MDTLMTQYDKLVPNKSPAEYYWFGVTTTFKCDHCEQTHEEEQSYLLGERFCPNPECTCREILLDVVRVDGKAGVSIANTLVDLDDFHVSLGTWRDVKLKSSVDHSALKNVTHDLNTCAALLEKFERHWQEVRVAVAVRHKRERQKQRARRRATIRR